MFGVSSICVLWFSRCVTSASIYARTQWSASRLSRPSSTFSRHARSLPATAQSIWIAARERSFTRWTYRKSDSIETRLHPHLHAKSSSYAIDRRATVQSDLSGLSFARRSADVVSLVLPPAPCRYLTLLSLVSSCHVFILHPIRYRQIELQVTQQLWNKSGCHATRLIIVRCCSHCGCNQSFNE